MFNDLHLIRLLCILLLGVTCAQHAGARVTEPATPPTVTAEEALAAYDRFRVAPERQLNEAPVFLRYMQGGAVHTVLNNRLVFFMYRAVPPDVQAVLYAAYMGANLDSQLRTRRQGDDPEAGMQAVLDTYTALKATHPGLVLAELEAFGQAVAKRGLAAAVDAMAAGKL